jgi:hypothetical protein
MEEVGTQQEGCGKIRLELGMLSSPTAVIESAAEIAAGRNKTVVPGAVVLHSSAAVCTARPEDHPGVVDATRMPARQMDHACRDHTVPRCAEVSGCAALY